MVKTKNMNTYIVLLRGVMPSEKNSIPKMASNRRDIPAEIPHGILSKDLIYNTLTIQQSTAVAYIKLMAEILDRK